MNSIKILLALLFTVGVASAQTSHSVTLTWTQSTDPVTGNQVARGGVSGGPYTIIACIAPGTTYVDNTVTAGSTYYYVVDAIEGTCSAPTAVSINSNEVKTVIPLSPPSALSAVAK